jgi:HSP20 family molecular chaperone IbpA
MLWRRRARVSKRYRGCNLVRSTDCAPSLIGSSTISFEAGRAVGGEARQWTPGIDVQERDDAIIVRADAPGFEPNDFDVEIRGDNLVLCACQSEESSQEEGVHWEKRELYESVPLPTAVDAEHIDAHYRNGVLTISLPKTEQAKGRKIEIKD